MAGAEEKKAEDSSSEAILDRCGRPAMIRLTADQQKKGGCDRLRLCWLRLEFCTTSCAMTAPRRLRRPLLRQLL